ncbi:PREDICTED: uncharacterized protein LOC109589679 [Amphimedon queenslandica]|uniref:IgGFc-binding protein N-terminal domain-containing protein n=1 Tax=Amphimedon queenslandica TaxID=400682 RepID=A0AAN0JVT1_AMPQE|nr:PREDICTED: uncharacterized protein LOC109589679 [Amphimedon queenslandica]|eukprot:XP_019861285.1 PREDICTED: uncharacterized protein LOC109589679 [Amphimedon queenslandica]
MLYHIMIIILLSICCIDGSEGSIDINKRLRGVPMTDTSEGNKFCFSFLKNKGTFYTKNLGIYIGTQESEPVQYRIRSGVSGVNRTGTVQPGEIRKEVYKTANMTPVTRADARSVNDFTGIIVETVNSSQKISIMGFSDAIGSSDGFTAVPIFNVSSIVENYTYSVFTGGPTGSDELALAAIVACDHITTGGVTLLYPQVPELDFLNSSNGYFQDQFFNAPNPSRIDFEQYYTPIIARNTDEAIAGITATSTQPIGFMTGHECGQIPDNKEGCDHLIEQVPPSYTWGYNFLIAPFHSRDFGYIIKTLSHSPFNTDFRVFCVENDNGVPLEADVSKWSAFYCDNITDVCGYGVSIDIVQGPHLLVHTDTTCSFSAVLFGWGEQKGYAYPAGFGMRPIAETFYSIAAVPSCEELLVDITVYRSGDLSQTSHIGVMINGDNENIQNVSFSTDESSQILPVPVNMTNLQDEEIVIKLIKSDEVHLGSPSSLLITVNDNGTIEVNSSVAVTPTHCTMTSDTNTPTEVYSSSYINNEEYTSSLILTGISSTVISTTIEPSSSPVSVGLSLIITTVMIGLTTVLFMISIIILATLSVYALYHNKAMAKNSNRGIDNAMYGVHEPPQAKK